MRNTPTYTNDLYNSKYYLTVTAVKQKHLILKEHKFAPNELNFTYYLYT